MFSGIIECTGKIEDINPNKDNLDITISSDIAKEVSVGDSIAHNGICLTVTSHKGLTHEVTASRETIKKTNIKNLKAGDFINLERALLVNSRFDGHIVQGHVDTTGECTKIEQLEGSTIFCFSYLQRFSSLIIEKGSISLNGISLTTINVTGKGFCVAIIPYTLKATTLQYMRTGDIVNLEFDIIGKYVQRISSTYTK